MPIFDNELPKSPIGGNDIKLPEPVLGSPSRPQVNTNLGGFGVPETGSTGLGLDQLADLANIPNKQNTFDSPFTAVPKSELLANQRYSMYQRNSDLENIYGLQQSWASQLGNSLVNMGVTAMGTFAQGFANIPNAIAAAQSGNVAKLSGDVDGYEGSIDNWIKNVKDDFPNYYTRYEKEHPYLAMIPGFRGSANFWGDKVITNFGFTIGAIGSAIAQDAIIGGITGGIGAIPLIGSQIGRASLALNKIFAGTNDLNKVLNVGKIVAAGEQAILNTTNLARAAQYVKLTNGFKYGVGIIGSAQTEAGVESRDGYRQVKEALTKQYKLDHLGEEPTGKDAEEIESYATSSMNTRFGINMALLTVSNAIQFGTLFKSLKNTAKGPITGGLVRDLEDAGKIGLKKGSLDVFEKQAVTALPEKIWESVRPRLADILREGVYEEGGQFAAERGTYDYYTRKYKDPSRKSNVNNWNQLDQVIKSTGYGLAEQFGSQEGFENMIVGAISGMLMGGAMGKFDKLRGQGKDARLQSSINIINRYGVTGIMSDKYNDTLSSIGNSQEMQDAAKSGDVFKFKNLKEDQFFTFVQSRIPSGMHDVTIDQLDMLKDLSKEQFEQTFGMEFNESNKSTVSEYVDGLIVKANEIKTTTDALNNVFKNPFTYTADPKTPEEQNISDKYKAFESWKIDLSYYANIEPNANARLASIQQSVANISPLLNNDLIAKLANKEGIKELGNLYEERAAQLNKTITEFTTPADKASIKAQVKALRTASERINLTDIYDLNTFDFLLNFELNNQDATKDRMISPEKMFDIFTYAHDINRLKFRKKRAGEIYEALSSEKGFNDYFKQQEDIINQNKPEEKTVTTPEEDEAVGPQFTNKYGQKEDIQIGREYQISAFKKAQVDKLDEDRWQVTAPDGTLTFHKTEEKAKEIADELNIDFVSLGKVRVLSINPDGTFKVEDLDGNIQNINPDKLSGYEKVQTRQEQLLKFAENIDKEQQEIENNSGVVATGNNVADITEMAAVPWEDKRKPTSMLFTSSKTESEGSETWEAPIESAPHITRSREFMSNAAFFPNRNDIYSILVTSNNEKALGLEGLASLSLNGNVGNVNDPKGGFLAQVFVQYKNGKREFIDKNGQPITEGNVLDQVIFQTMPTTSLTAEDSKGNKYDLHRKGEKEQAEIEKQRYTAFREVLFNDTSANPHMYKFNISRGIPVENITQVKDAKGNVIEISYEKNNIIETLLPTDVEELINTQQGLITLSIDGTIVHHGESVKVPKGRPVFQYGDTMIPVWNAQFNSSDAKSIYEVIKLMGEGIDDLSKMRPYTTFLKNVLYWKRSSGNKSQNQIYIDTTNMQLHLGKESYDISEIPNLETTITNQLKTIFANVNNDGLTKNFTSSFREFYFEDGQLKNREWDNYQTYLLDNKYPDGSNRSINDTPLSTSVAKRTPAVPFNFKQRYSTLSDIDMPNVEVTPKAVTEVKPVPTESKTYTFPSGNAVQYVSEIKDGKIYIDPVSGILDGELVTKTANDPAQVAKFKSTLEDTEGLSNKEIVKLALSITLTDLLNKEPVAPTAPVVSDEKTDIEKRRQEELDKYNSGDITVAGVKAINDKYNAELAALEGVKPEDYNPENTSEPEDQYKKVGVKEEGKETITEVDIAAFRKYVAEVAPGIPYEFVDNYIDVVGTDEKAYGVFTNGMAKIFKGATRGSEYHELMEGIWNGFLSPEQQQAIIDEFKSSKGKFTDRETGKKIAYSDATDTQAKERIMDNFSDFRLGKLPAKNISEKILRFFKAIINWFKNLLVNDKLQKALFKKVETGGFKEFKLNDSIKYLPPQYKKVERLSYTKANLFVQDMVIRASNIMFGKKKEDLYNFRAITGNDVFNEIEQLYIKEGKRQELGDKAWQQLVQRTKDNLRTLLGVQFSDEVEEVTNQEGANNRDYAKDPFDVDMKSNSFGIRLTLGTLPLVTTKKIPGVLPKRQSSDVKGYKLLEFDKAFATVLDRLSNTTSIPKAIDKLVKLANQDPTYVRVFQRIGGDPTTMTINFDSFKDADWRLFIDFMGTFTRMKPDVVIQYINGNEVFIGEANLFSAVRTLTDSWINNIRELARTPKSYIKYVKETQTYQADEQLFKDTNIKGIEGKIGFLNNLGITFPMEVYNKLNDKDKDEIGEQASKLFTYLQNVKDFVTLSRDVLNVKDRLNTIAEIYIRTTNPLVDNTYEGIDGKTRQAYALNNAVSVFVNDFNESDSLEDLKNKRPELNDVFSEHSLTLKKGGLYFDKKGKRIDGVKLNIGVIGGTFNNNKDKGIASVKLNKGARFTQEFNENIVGKYYVINPADANSEWEVNLRNHVSFDDVQEGLGWSKIYNIFNGYLKDDISLALDSDNRTPLKNVGEKSKELRFFKDILSSKTLKGLEPLISNGVIRSQIDDYIKTNQADINESIKAYIENNVNRLFNALRETEQIFKISDITYSFSGLLSKFAEENELNKMTLTKNDIDNITKYVAINKIIALIEYHKILVGDPLQFKIKEEKGDITYDETKRLKSWQSPRKTTFDTVEFRNYYNTQYNKTGLPGEENRISLTPDDIGYSVFDQFINTSTIEDVTVVGSLVKNLANYFDVNESDANSIISDILFRQVKLRNAQWPKEAEAFHQWQMAYTRKQLAKKKVYDYKDNTALKEHDEKLTSKPSPQYKIEVLKPIVTGNKFRKNYFDQILDKFSQMPLYYSAVENKGLEDLYIKMWKEKRGYIIAESGRKVGTEERHKLYNSEFKFNNEPFNNLVQVPWKAYGIQVENEYNDANGEVASGSQITKIISVNLFNNGVPISTDAEKYYTRNTDALKAILKNGFTSYLDKMGLKDVGANYEIVDRKKLAESLEFIMLQRTVSDNVRDTIQLDENNQFLIPFESSPAYVQIRDIIYSILDKSIVSRKTSGGAYVQAPVTLWENSKIGRRIALKTDTGYEFITTDKYNSLSEKEKKNVVLTDDTLRMPTIDDPYMEIFIPSWFKVKLGVGTKFADETALLKYLNGTKEGQKILKGIAFRTPSQAPSSIDAIRVKGFLPDYMGKTVIVPSEITKKTNSDFDIDKLSIYLKSIYKDKNGDIRLIEYKGSEEATKEFYADVFDEVLENSKIEKAKLLEAAQILSYGLDDPNNLVDRYFNLLNTLLEGVSESTNIEDSIIKQLEKLGDANIQAEFKNKFINSSYKKALENEYYESLEEIMSLPETFIQRITPVDDAGLEDLANEIDRLRGFTESGIQNRIVDGVYLTNTRHNMALAKSWVGRAAINITSQSNTQKGKVVISYERIEKLEDARDKELLGNGKLLLPHNPLTINGVDYISISNVTDTNGEYISHILSGYGTAFVDVANKPFIVKIVKSDLAVNTFLFLSRATVRKSHVGKFMSQPIIDEYLTMLDNQGASNLYGKTNINTIKQKFGASESLIAQIETLDVDEFDSNIEKYYKYKKEFTDLENAKQQFILNEFLKYAKMADYSFDVNQALNYDTTSFRSGDILFQKQLKTKKALESNIFIGIQDILDNTFLGEQADILDDAFAATGEILVLEKPEFRDITDKLLTPFAIKKYLSKDDFSKIGNKIKLSFLDFIINTKSEINEDIQSLLIDSQTSAVNQLAIAKRDYPNLAILNELEQVNSTRENGVKTIKLKVNLRNNPNIINLYTDYMRELRENPNTRELFNNLVKLAILQGVYKSPVSLNPIIPVESYAEIVSPIITGLVADNTLDAFSKGAFQRNNFKNNDIFYQIEPKFFGSQYDPMTEEPTYYTSKTYFPIGGEFNISLQDRKILILSEAWNYAATTYDYIKFPRVIKETRKGVPTGTYIDAVTGKPITERGLKIMREKGNLSASDIFGYQKVRDNEGKPLTIEENGEVKHVYKLINLYGDGNLTTEYYTDFRPSVINNGTITINEEIPDEDIIRYYLDKKQVVLKENNVSLPPQGTQLIPVQPDVEFAIDGNIYYMKPNGNITYSNGSLVKDSVIINQVSARKQIQEGNIKVAVFDGVNYFVLSNGKIIDATKEDFGEEPTLTEKEKEIILAKAITYKKNC